MSYTKNPDHQHFPWGLSAKFVFRKRLFKILKITFWSGLTSYQLIFKKWCEFDWYDQELLIWPTNRFSKAQPYNFYFHKNDVTSLPSSNCLLQSVKSGYQQDWNALTFNSSLNLHHIEVKRKEKEEKNSK